MTKKLLSVIICLLTAAACFLLLPTQAHAVEITSSGTCGENVTWTLDDTGTLTISGTGEMFHYYYSGSVPWYDVRAEITSAVIENGVTAIGDYAFYGCTGLTSVTISEGVTSIGFGAFYGCTGLTSVTIPSSVTSIEITAFQGCTGLTGIWVDENNQYYSNDKYGILYTKDQRVLLCAPGGITEIGDVPSSVVSIGGSAFHGCTSLTSVTIPGSVTSIGSGAFEGCTGLTSVTISESVTSIGSDAFYTCTGLTSVTIPGSVTSIGNSAFSGCTGLTSVTISKGVTSIGFGAFYGCTGLTSVTIPSSVTSIEITAFQGCTGLTGIWVDENNQYYSNDKYGILYTKDQRVLLCAPGGITEIGDVPGNVDRIGNSAFHGCTSLTSVTIPDSVTSIGDSAFEGCTSLTGVTIPDSVTEIAYYAFSGCTSLINVDMPDSLKIICERAFEDCTGLTSVTIHAGVGKIGYWAFGNCNNLTHVLFTGTEDQWNTISISSDNGGLTSATRHYECTGDEITVTDTCTKTSCYCAVCQTEFYSVSKSGSCTWDDGVVTKPATCKEEGVKTYTCSACGDTKTETIAKTAEHSFVDCVCTVCGETAYVSGDIGCDGIVNSDDVVQLLLYVSMPDEFPVNVEADFTGDGTVTSDDVVQLLLHISMPDLFPLQATAATTYALPVRKDTVL